MNIKGPKQRPTYACLVNIKTLEETDSAGNVKEDGVCFL